uniref:PDZ domain-containing protein n=1 Tax=Steinernema glaseri TaxID=37863 RepID=A0A1I7YIW5_9BILA
MTSEVVTVRMSRGDLTTPWGFTVQHPAVINNIIGSSLADRAGLQNGDVIEEIQGYQNPDYAAATHALEASKHSIEIVVIRNAGTPRLWKPQLSENAEMNRFQHSVHNMGPPAGNPPPPPPPTSHPIKVSLEHRKEEVPIRGFNVSAKPFASSEIQASNQQQYNTPINLYNAQSAAEQYLQQTGGLFGTDPNLAKQKEEPAYLRSETLRLIRENDEHARGERLTTPAVSSRYSPRINELDPLRNQPNPQGLPQCYLCGRNILARSFQGEAQVDVGAQCSRAAGEAPPAAARRRVPQN